MGGLNNGNLGDLPFKCNFIEVSPSWILINFVHDPPQCLSSYFHLSTLNAFNSHMKVIFLTMMLT